MPVPSHRPRAARARVVTIVAALIVVALTGGASTGPAASAHAAAERTAVKRATAYKVTVDRRMYGVHDASLNSLSRSGTGSIRLWDTGTTWPQIEPTEGSWSWTRLDQIVAAAWAEHTEVTFVAAMTPSWALADPTQVGSTSPPRVTAYSEYLKAVMDRYQNYDGSGHPGIADYQVWNEANISTFWTGTTGQMARLVKAARDARNAVDPKVKVIAPAMVTRLPYEQKWIKAFYQEVVGGRPVWKYVNAISLNLYPRDTYPTGSGTRAGTPEDSMMLLRQVRGLLAGDKVPGSVPIWDTEINYGMRTGSMGGQSAELIPDSRQIAYVMRTYLLNAGQGVKRVDWYSYDMGDLPADKGGTPLGNTLLTDPDPAVRSEGLLTPAGHAFARVQGWLNGTMIGTTSRRPCIKDENGTYTCTIRYATGMGRVYWNPYHHAKVRLVRSARKLVDEYGVTSSVRGGSRLRVNYQPVLVRSKR